MRVKVHGEIARNCLASWRHAADKCSHARSGHHSFEAWPKLLHLVVEIEGVPGSFAIRCQPPNAGTNPE
jgi:hypothetical protein